MTRCLLLKSPNDNDTEGTLTTPPATDHKIDRRAILHELLLGQDRSASRPLGLTIPESFLVRADKVMDN
jgi:hypothetical protein